MQSRHFMPKNLICKLTITLRWRKRQSVFGYFCVIYEYASWFWVALNSLSYGHHVLKELWTSPLFWKQTFNFLNTNIRRNSQHNSRNVFHKLVSDLFFHQCTKWLIVLNVTRVWCMTLLGDVKNAKFNDVKNAKLNDVS